ncbi:MAG TPA: metallophosphoesterase family protein [Pirellulaceae bacterium]|nr:metallophosphoesterase family protein [Pirellulaceae bacterium]HMO90744.1 metallophosphoesterase family protein [Pirellulaceae bacterium]HMP67995.1 metallophosphoesterase family protein [Pirellulaceae bacterium]
MNSSKLAIISDVHANLEALQSVLEDIGAQNIKDIYCLGDIIGYGPNPIECIDLVMEKCTRTILGNHDQAVIFDPEGFNPVALRAIFWTRDQMEQNIGGTTKSDQRWDFIGELPRRIDEGTNLFVHGSPRDPTNEYVFPEYVYDRDRLEQMFRRFELYCFHGHTHIPGIITESGKFLAPEDVGYIYKLNQEKALINVGSVGQPRDEDPRACYVVLQRDEKIVEYRRVKYDIDTTRNKIYGIPSLDNMLGDRLNRGN